jgi:drug/metabolite transporter (DMT)-like permease
MNWFSIALGCAVLTACCDALSKKIMEENDEWIAGTLILTIASVILAPIFASLELKPFSFDLVAVFAVVFPLEVLGYYFFLSSIRMAHLSLTVPLLAFTPVFTLLTAWIILGEQINPSGYLGIGLVTVGAYLLNSNLMGLHVLAPIKAIVLSPGSRRMLFVAVIWSVTTTLGKKGVLLYGAIPFGFVVLVGVTGMFAVASLFRWRVGRVKMQLGQATAGFLLFAGIFMAGAQITHFVSLSMAPAAYMISVKRLSMVFGVMLGWLMFREENVRYRLIGASVMVVGSFFLYP